MSKTNFTRRQFINTVSAGAIASLAFQEAFAGASESKAAGKLSWSSDSKTKMNWKAGIGTRVMTPKTDVWLAGYGTKRAADGMIHDIYVKVLALKSADGKRAVMATTDSQGMSKVIYESLYKKIHTRFKLERSEFMLTFSHNHSGPCLREDLADYYPSDDHQKQLVSEYSDWLEDQILGAVGDALKNLQTVKLYKGQGHCTFAVNRRDNPEEDVPKYLAGGKPLKGVVDHSVPVLAIKDKKDILIGALFGYACHPTTLSLNLWNGDYPGYAQINLEANHPGMKAMFFNACGGDQNPLPRRTIELCEKYGKMLSDAVEEVLTKPMVPISSTLSSAFEYVNLDYEKVATRAELIVIAEGKSALHARWAKRLLKKLDSGEVFQKSTPYPVQGWQLGRELLLIGLGGESVVDYSLRFKKEYSEQSTWVAGYSNYMVAYIPSRRVWEEGGYEGGPHIDEYGHPAWKWAGDVEDRISNTVRKVVGTIHAN